MNKRIDFSNLGGLPLYQDTLEFLQSGFQGPFSGIATALGSRVIISGVTDLGNDYSNGWVCIDGEILPFVSGLKAANIVIEEIADTEVLNDDSVRAVYFTRRAKASSVSVNAFPIASFVRISDLSALTTELSTLVSRVNQLPVVPKGIISMWSGAIANIPSGWALCDGTNNTPNLRGMFIVGYDATDPDYNIIGKGTKGKKTVQLTTSEMPPHMHPYKDRYSSGYRNVSQYQEPVPTNWPNLIGDRDIFNYRNDYFYYFPTNTESSGGSNGEASAHENRPPYYTLAYIIKL